MPTLSPFPLTTPRLKLRLHQSGDLEDLLAYHGQPGVARYLLNVPWTPAEAERQMHKRLQRTDLRQSETLPLVWEYGGKVIGDTSLWLTDDAGESSGEVAEVGWVMNPAFGGQGLATEAVSAVLNLAFDHYRLHRVVAQMDARNTASAKLCERLGMKKEAHLRQNWWSKGEWTDTMIYASLASDRA